MTPVPFDLPIRPAEAGALAGLIFEHAEGKALSEEIRGRLSGRAAKMAFENLTPYLGSLERDQVHPSSYYVAVDGATPLLLHMAPASAPTGSVFSKPLLIGRMRTPRGQEIVINAIAFAASDHDNIRQYAEQVNRAFLPRPQGPQAAIAVSIPAAFDAFRAILKNRRLNLASLARPYHAAVWAAIRAGWREGYTAEADPLLIAGATPDEVRRSLAAAKEAIRRDAGYTKFVTVTSSLFFPVPANAATAEKLEQILSAEERAWILGEFSQPFRIGDGAYHFTAGEVERLAVRFGQSLKVNEELFDAIRSAKAASRQRPFDFEPSLDGSETPSTPKELIFYLHWLKARGRAAQLVAPSLGSAAAEDFGGRVKELAAVARHFNATLSIQPGDGEPPAKTLELIGKATGRRVNCKIPGECSPAAIVSAAESLFG